MKETLEINDVLTTKDVAEQLHVHIDTVRDMARLGKIPSIRIGKRYRFRRQDIDEFLKGNNR